MAKPVCMGAVLQCTFGMAPSNLVILDPTRPMIQNKFVGNIMDFAPIANIPPFGMCQSMSNPQVASATAAAMGTLTPMPCIPVIVGTWTPGGKDKVANMPMLVDSCQLRCAWGGTITIKQPGQTTNVTAE